MRKTKEQTRKKEKSILNIKTHTANTNYEYRYRNEYKKKGKQGEMHTIYLFDYVLALKATGMGRCKEVKQVTMYIEMDSYRERKKKKKLLHQRHFCPPAFSEDK